MIHGLRSPRCVVSWILWASSRLLQPTHLSRTPFFMNHHSIKNFIAFRRKNVALDKKLFRWVEPQSCDVCVSICCWCLFIERSIFSPKVFLKYEIQDRTKALNIWIGYWRGELVHKIQYSIQILRRSLWISYVFYLNYSWLFKSHTFFVWILS